MIYGFSLGEERSGTLDVRRDRSCAYSPGSITEVEDPVCVIALASGQPMRSLVDMVITLKNRINPILLKYWTPRLSYFYRIRLSPGSPRWAMVTDELGGNISSLPKGLLQPGSL